MLPPPGQAHLEGSSSTITGRSLAVSSSSSSSAAALFGNAQGARCATNLLAAAAAETRYPNKVLALRDMEKCDCGKTTCKTYDNPTATYILPGYRNSSSALRAINLIQTTNARRDDHENVVVALPGMNVNKLLQSLEVPWGIQDREKDGYLAGQLAVGKVGGAYLERTTVVETFGDPLNKRPVDVALRFASGKFVAFVPSRALSRPKEQMPPRRLRRQLLRTMDKTCEARSTITFIVEYFRRPKLINIIARRLSFAAGLSRRFPKVEILVNNDGLTDRDAWAHQLLLATKRSGVSAAIFHSGNIHEVRAYNRMARAATGSHIVFMQDDDVPPPPPVLRHVLGQITHLLCTRQYRGLALVGGLSGTIEGGPYTGKYSTRPGRRPIPPNFKDKTGRKFMYAPLVNMGPFAVDRSIFLKVGMFHQGYSCRGEPGIQFDFEFSLRLWKLGYRAGIMDFKMGYQASGQASGTRANRFMYHKRKRIDTRNQAFYSRMYSGFYKIQGDYHTRRGTNNPTGVQKLATDANRELLRRIG
ncbi:glyco_trans_2-like domain-containing protein [Pycnococcus provasolii]